LAGTADDESCVHWAMYLAETKCKMRKSMAYIHSAGDMPIAEGALAYLWIQLNLSVSRVEWNENYKKEL